MHLPWVESLGRFLFCILGILLRKFYGALYIQEATPRPPALGSVKISFRIPPGMLWFALAIPWPGLAILVVLGYLIWEIH